ncbi:hypothetical protein DFH11DRAFT_1687692 [Phellopilus nigrolimitatus]|nr:hypothetical protein DFH11DRAFT_1687692 [Phellopilus nigrolimitatus]
MDQAASNVRTQQQPQQQQESDFWEFVNCAKCHLAFSRDGVAAPSVPFWITECGHILCNAHLNADQSCPVCSALGIELMPLQKEMPPPMSDWFRSVPYGMDALAQAAKFQHESMAAEIRYYKSRSVRFESLIQRLKGEVAAVRAFKQDYEALKRENEQLCSGRAVPQEPGQAVNANGKRRMVDPRVATSSPRSIRTPLGPPRITLPPDHDPPPSFVKPGGTDGARSGQQVRTDRPGSSTFSKQYAYDPPQAAHMQMPQVLSHAQQAPTRQMQTQNDRRLMPPPPTPAYARQQQGLVQGRQMQRAATPRISVEANQGPSNPLAFGQQQQRAPPHRFVPSLAPASAGPGTNGSTGRYFVASTPTTASRRFVPSTPSMNATSSGHPNRFVPSIGSHPAPGPTRG